MIGKGYRDEDVIRAIAKGLEDFYDSLITKIDSINIKLIMRRKNPYLYRAKAMQNANDIVSSVLDAFITSSEETAFGNCFFEPLAIAASGGSKALAEGVDIMIHEDNAIYAVAVKSGPSVFNSDSKKRQEQNFMAAAKLAKQAKARYEAVIGYGYGRKKQSDKGVPKIYREMAGQEFWAELTGEPDFYLKIIIFMGTLPEQYLEQYQHSYNNAKNRLLKQFTAEFCTDNGEIDWDKLVRFNSGAGFK